MYDGADSLRMLIQRPVRISITLGLESSRSSLGKCFCVKEHCILHLATSCYTLLMDHTLYSHTNHSVVSVMVQFNLEAQL